MSEFSRPSLYKPLIISVVLMFLQQWSGINAVLFYSVDTFKYAAPSIEPHISAVIIAAVQVVATFVSVILMDRAGRRVLLLVAGMECICGHSSSLSLGVSDSDVL